MGTTIAGNIVTRAGGAAKAGPAPETVLTLMAGGGIYPVLEAERSIVPEEAR